MTIAIISAKLRWVAPGEIKLVNAAPDAKSFLKLHEFRQFVIFEATKNHSGTSLLNFELGKLGVKYTKKDPTLILISRKPNDRPPGAVSS
ncbi:hypothetical protein KM043_010819 [Ampulex compressa]|nr:hypothetical protein KM043_010819 [Ampulex compressa]